MQKFIPALKIVLIVCIVFLAAVTVLGLVVGAEKPFQPVFPMLMGLFAFRPAVDIDLADAEMPDLRNAAARAAQADVVPASWSAAAGPAPNCGTEIDRHGRAIDKAASR